MFIQRFSSTTIFINFSKFSFSTVITTMKALDKDHDGFITKDEFAKLHKTMSPKQVYLQMNGKMILFTG